MPYCRSLNLPVLRRGLRDTKTPLWGTAASTVVNYGLHILFMGSYGWGVLGAGWAVVWGQWVGSVLLVGRLGTVGAIHWPDMLKLPSGHEMAATLKAMVALSVTYLVQVRTHCLPPPARRESCTSLLQWLIVIIRSMAVSLHAQVPPQLIATSVAGGAGAAVLAAHTVVRQLFEFWGLTFTAFNVATQSLVASALAKVRLQPHACANTAESMPRMDRRRFNHWMQGRAWCLAHTAMRCGGAGHGEARARDPGARAAAGRPGRGRRRGQPGALGQGGVGRRGRHVHHGPGCADGQQRRAAARVPRDGDSQRLQQSTITAVFIQPFYSSQG